MEAAQLGSPREAGGRGGGVAESREGGPGAVVPVCHSRWDRTYVRWHNFHMLNGGKKTSNIFFSFLHHSNNPF